MYEKIRELAHKRNSSIPAVEKACGLSNGAISKWDISIPRADNLKKVADYLGVSTDYLLSVAGAKK